MVPQLTASREQQARRATAGAAEVSELREACCASVRASAAEMKPFPSLSNTLKASRSSSSLSVSCARRREKCEKREGPWGESRAGTCLHLARHEVEELGEVDGAVAVRVNLESGREKLSSVCQPLAAFRRKMSPLGSAASARLSRGSIAGCRERCFAASAPP
jgi:hypothetical protein